MIKKTLLASAIAAFAMTPALAQGWTPYPAQINASGVGAPERAGPPLRGPGAYSRHASGPYAYNGPNAYDRSYAYDQSYAYDGAGSPFFGGQVAVSTDGQIIGADPDASIRSDLHRNQDVQLGRGSS